MKVDPRVIEVYSAPPKSGLKPLILQPAKGREMALIQTRSWSDPKKYRNELHLVISGTRNRRDPLLIDRLRIQASDTLEKKSAEAKIFIHEFVTFLRGKIIANVFAFYFTSH